MVQINKQINVLHSLHRHIKANKGGHSTKHPLMLSADLQLDFGKQKQLKLRNRFSFDLDMTGLHLRPAEHGLCCGQTFGILQGPELHFVASDSRSGH